eukprot:7319345-Lingulodinium_polyedra.AAC.1
MPAAPSKPTWSSGSFSFSHTISGGGSAPRTLPGPLSESSLCSGGSPDPPGSAEPRAPPGDGPL